MNKECAHVRNFIKYNATDCVWCWFKQAVPLFNQGQHWLCEKDYLSKGPSSSMCASYICFFYENQK